MKLDLACGKNCKEGFDGADIRQLQGVKYCVDLCKTDWPYEWYSDKDPVTEVWCSHFVEHIPNLIQFMNQLWDICAPDAKVTIIHPYQFSMRAWQDPTHVRCLNENSWFYYNQKWLEEQGLDHYDIRANFEIIKTDVTYNQSVVDNHEKKVMDETIIHLLANYGVNIIDDMIVTLRAVK